MTIRNYTKGFEKLMQEANFVVYSILLSKNGVCLKFFFSQLPFPVIKLQNISTVSVFSFKQFGTHLVSSNLVHVLTTIRSFQEVLQQNMTEIGHSKA